MQRISPVDKDITFVEKRYEGLNGVASDPAGTISQMTRGRPRPPAKPARLAAV
jgi:hypothetical protein